MVALSQGVQAPTSTSPAPASEAVSGSSCRFKFRASGELNQINDEVYEVGKLAPGILPSIELVFFHGLQWMNGDEDVFSRTWTSEDNSELWPKWFKDRNKFPEARILITSYDAWAQKNSTQGRLDDYTLPESLLISLMLADVGQHGCPVILVGHGVGCLVLKAVCERAFFSLHLNEMEKEKLDYFLNHIKGMFYFSPPSLGMDLADELLKISTSPGPWLEILKILSDQAVRLNEIFRKLRGKYKWKSVAVGETQPVHLELEARTVNLEPQGPVLKLY